MTALLARRNLFHEKSKLFLSVTGVAASLALIILLMGFREGLYATLTAYVDNMGADLIIAQDGVQGIFSSDSTIPLKFHDRIVRLANATETSHILTADVIFTHKDMKIPVLLVGYQPSNPFGSPWKLSEGRLISKDDEILFDTWLAQRIGKTVGDEIDLLGKRFKVVGLTLETSSWMSPYIFISLDAARSALGLSGMVSYHLIRLPDGTEVGEAKQVIENSVSGVEALTPKEIAAADRRVLATVMDTPLNIMLVIGTAIGAAVMGLTTYTTVTDQMREYGLLKAIGSNGGRLVRIVTTETMLRAGMGFALGVGLSYLAGFLIMARWPQFNVLIRPENLVQAGGLALAMSLIAALLPIQRLSRIDPLTVFKE